MLLFLFLKEKQETIPLEPVGVFFDDVFEPVNGCIVTEADGNATRCQEFVFVFLYQECCRHCVIY